MTAAVLIALPPGVALAEFIISPSNLKMLISDPLGVRMVIGAIVLQVIGMFAIRQIVRVEY
jgi:tight adherence protein B